MSELTAKDYRGAVLLCVDDECLSASMGFLSEEREHACPWLVHYASAVEARRSAEERPVDEIWVASSDEVEGINLAAALKADCPDATVLLAGCEKTGSVLSRVRSASLDGTISFEELEKRLACYEEQGGPRRHGAEGAGAPVDSPSAAQGFLLSIVSGSGGAGKSTVAVLAAHLAARRGLRVALLDADFQFGDLRELAGIEAGLAADELLHDPSQLDELAAADMVLVAAPRRLEQAEAVADRLDDVLDKLLGSYDLVVANTGGTWDEQRLHLLERSMTALFLVDQRVSSVRACRHALDLCLRCGVATGSFLLAVNRCQRRASFTSIDVSSALQGAHVIELAEGGSDVEELVGSGLAAHLVEAGNPLCASIDAVLDEVLPAGASRSPSTRLSQTVARVGVPRMGEAVGSRSGRRSSRKRFRGIVSAEPQSMGARG